MGQKLSKLDKSTPKAPVIDVSDSEDVIEIPIQRSFPRELPEDRTIEISDDSDVTEVPVTEPQSSIMNKIKDVEHSLEEQQLTSLILLFFCLLRIKRYQ